VTGEACMGNPAFCDGLAANELAGRGTPYAAAIWCYSGALGPDGSG